MKVSVQTPENAFIIPFKEESICQISLHWIHLKTQLFQSVSMETPSVPRQTIIQHSTTTMKKK